MLLIVFGEREHARERETVSAVSLLLETRNLGRYAPKFLAPAEGWWPSATDWQGLFIFFGGG